MPPIEAWQVQIPSLHPLFSYLITLVPPPAKSLMMSVGAYIRTSMEIVQYEIFLNLMGKFSHAYAYSVAA